MMKTITNKIILFFCLIAVTLTSSSCLKDDPLFDWDQAGVVVEMPYKSHYILRTSVIPTTNQVFELMVNYTVPYASDNKTDLSVQLGVDEAMLATYNAGLAAETKKYVLLPAGTYTLPSPIIKAGTQLWKESMTVNTSTLKPGAKYLLPIKIVGVPTGYTISGNFGHLYLRIDMK